MTNIDLSNQERVETTSVENGFIIDVRRKDWAMLIALAIGAKLLTFIYGGQSNQILNDNQRQNISEWITNWYRWDAHQYKSLAELGYQYSEQTQASLVFYPLYPWLMRVFNLLTGDSMLSGVIISTFASFALLIILYELVRLDFDRKTAMRASWFLLIFPTAYFLHVPYTESLFLALVVGSFYAARRNEWFIACMLGGYATATRAQGLVLVAALGTEAIHQIYKSRKFSFNYLWLLIVPSGFFLYLYVIYWSTGDPFSMFEIRKQSYYIVSASPWDGLKGAFGQLDYSKAHGQISGVQEFLFVCIGLAATIACWFKLRPSYATWMTVSWLLFMSVNFIASIPRYTLALFPIFILFSLVSKNVFWFGIITIWSVMYYTLFSGLFMTGRWAF